MTLYILSFHGGLLYNDLCGEGRVVAYLGYEDAKKRAAQLDACGVTGLHVREFERSQQRGDWKEREADENLRGTNHAPGRREEGY